MAARILHQADPGGVARFRFTPSAELEPWIRIISLTLLVDGQPWAVHEYVRVSPDAGVQRVAAQANRR